MPQLIEKYRAQREAWMAQADELARLKDEVRGSAEREAMEIVTAARRDIRKIIMEARRELFVLSAQVQAALGEAPPPAQLGAGQREDERTAIDDELAAFAKEEWGFAPRSSVTAVLEEARADMAVLDQDARAVPARTPAPPDAGEEPGDGTPQPADETPRHRPPPTPSLAAADTYDGTSVRWFAAVFLLAAFVLVMGTIWALRSPGEPADPAAAQRAAATQPASDAAPSTGSTPDAAATSDRPAAPPSDPTAVRLSIEAVRPAWIRAVVDGRGNAGQMLQAGETYEFSGRTIALRVGDAGAVRVSVNGGEARPLGRDGQVVDREFSLDGAAPANESRTRAGEEAVVERSPAHDDDEGPAAVVSEDASPAEPAAPVVRATAPVAEPVAATTGRVVSTAAAPEAGRAAAARTAPDATAEAALVTSAQRWLDAYYRQDQVMLAVLSSPDAAIVDERPTSERIPVTAGPIARTLDRVSVRVAADTAVLTGIMTERALNGGLQRSSPVSLVWVAADGSWRLSQARLVSQSTLGRFLR